MFTRLIKTKYVMKLVGIFVCPPVILSCVCTDYGQVHTASRRFCGRKGHDDTETVYIAYTRETCETCHTDVTEVR